MSKFLVAVGFQVFCAFFLLQNLNSQFINTLEEDVDLEKFGFYPQYEGLEADQAILRLKKNNRCAVYSLEDYYLTGGSPTMLSPALYDSIQVVKLEELNCMQYFFFQGGKVGYLDAGTKLTIKNKIKLEFDSIQFISEKSKENIWSSSIDYCLIHKGGTWRYFSMSKPKQILALQHQFADSLDFKPLSYGVNEAIFYIQEKLGATDIELLPEEFNPIEYRDIITATNYTLFFKVKHPKTNTWGAIEYKRQSNRNQIDKIWDFEFDEIEFEIIYDRNLTLLGKRSGTWGRYNFLEQFAITKTTYSSSEDVPKIFVDKMEHDKELKLKDQLKAEIIEYDRGNGDGVFIAKLIKNKKWGMYQNLGKEIQTIIPAQFDSISFFGWNGLFTGVWNNNKVGIYQSVWTYGEDDARQTVECLYDDYKKFNVERNINSNGYYMKKTLVYLAVKRDGLWAWIDWMTGELKTEFLYDLEKEKMPYPNFEQEN